MPCSRSLPPCRSRSRPGCLPRLAIAGANSGAGKTTLSIALMAAWTRLGMTVQPFKVGPDYIDPAFHCAVTGRPGRNLDAWLVPEPELAGLFIRNAPEQGLSLIEGVMGLYDGLGSGPFASTAHVAALLEAPVLLVVHAQGMSLSAAALVSGFANFRPGAAREGKPPVDSNGGFDVPDLSGLRIGGVILNSLAGERQFALLREAIEGHTGIPCFGWLPKNLPSLPHRHLGLVPAEEQRDMSGYVDVLVRAVGEHVDLPGLLALAESAPPVRARTDSAIPPPGPATAMPQHLPAAGSPGAETAKAPGMSRSPFPEHSPDERPRIAVARDVAFSFYYPDNLECLEELGAKLVPCSPLADPALPDGVDGLYLGGGFPEVFADRLEANAAFRASLRAALEGGLPAYAECGGMLYLCDTLSPLAKPDGGERAMAGFFAAKAEMTGRLQPFGYVTVTLERDCLLGPAGRTFRAHEFHYSRILPARTKSPAGGDPDNAPDNSLDNAQDEPPGPPEDASPLIRSEKPGGGRAPTGWTGGMARNNVVAWYPHLHFRGCPEAAQSFVSACRAFRRQRPARP